MSLRSPALEEARLAGLEFYWTGVPCRHGHLAYRRTKDRGCTACRSRIDKRSYGKHRLKRIAKTVRWRSANKEKCRKWALNNPEAMRRSVGKWQRNNRDHRNAYRRRITAENPGFKIRVNLANRIVQAVKYQTGVKSKRTLDLIGCSVSELKAHLERQLVPGMSWGNYGYGSDKWHIDHIRPCKDFDLTVPGEQQKCFHYSNLRPLWQIDNMARRYE